MPAHNVQCLSTTTEVSISRESEMVSPACASGTGMNWRCRLPLRYKAWSSGSAMFTLYTAYTDDEPDDVIIEELIDWLSRRMPKTVEDFKKRIAEEPDFRASMVLLMRGRATILHSNNPDPTQVDRLRMQLKPRSRS